jgi:GNAT superfamily N-acetyltransferase
MARTYSIRPAGPGDLASVLRVLADNQPSRPIEHRVSMPRPSDRQVAMWRRVTNSPDVTVYLAELDGQAVGTACLAILPNITYDCRPTAFIEAVVVRYDHRRRGVARLMIRHALEDARRDACFKVQLLTHKRHASDGAHDFYRSLGFEAEADGFRLYLRDA